jgi:hypothetical protein
MGKKLLAGDVDVVGTAGSTCVAVLDVQQAGRPRDRRQDVPFCAIVMVNEPDNALRNGASVVRILVEKS